MSTGSESLGSYPLSKPSDPYSLMSILWTIIPRSASFGPFLLISGSYPWISVLRTPIPGLASSEPLSLDQLSDPIPGSASSGSLSMDQRPSDTYSHPSNPYLRSAYF